MESTKKLLQVILGAVFCLLTAGIIFGFSQLKIILLEEGVYGHLCPPQQNGCKDQVTRLQSIFVVAASATNFSAFPIGYILDRYGPKVSTIIGSLLFFLGCLLFGFSSPSLDMYYPAFLFLAIGGPFIFLSTINLSRAFPKYSGLIMAIITGAFDGSSVVFWVFLKIYKSSDSVTISAIFKVFSIVPILSFVFAVLLMPSTPYEVSSKPQVVINDMEQDQEQIADEADPLLSSQSDTELNQKHNIEEESLTNPDEEPVDNDGLFLREKTALQQIGSWCFLLLVIFSSVYMIRLNFYIGTINEQLLRLFDSKDSVNNLIEFFGIILPLGGILAIPSSSYLLNNFSLAVSYDVMAIRCLLFGVLSFIPSIFSQYIAMVIFAIMRPFLYTVINEFSARTFGFKNFGKVYGLLMMISGTFNLIQEVLGKFSLSLDRGFMIVNISLLVTCLLSSILLSGFLHYRKNMRSRNILLQSRPSVESFDTQL